MQQWFALKWSNSTKDETDLVEQYKVVNDCREIVEQLIDNCKIRFCTKNVLFAINFKGQKSMKGLSIMTS